MAQHYAPNPASTSSAVGPRPRTRLRHALTHPSALAHAAQVMAEIIAKSKAFKAEKQRQKEEDQDETDALDDQFRCAGRQAGEHTFIMAGTSCPAGRQSA